MSNVVLDKVTSQVKSPGRLHASFTHPPTTEISSNKTRWYVTEYIKKTHNVMQIELQIDRVTLHYHC